MKKLLLVLLFLPLILFSSTVTTVQEVLSKGHDHDNVILVGKLIQQLDHDEFIFSDTTGSIKIEFDDDYFDVRQLPEVNSKIKIKAIVDKEIFEHTELKVIKYKLLEKANNKDDF